VRRVLFSAMATVVVGVQTRDTFGPVEVIRLVAVEARALGGRYAPEYQTLMVEVASWTKLPYSGYTTRITRDAWHGLRNVPARPQPCPSRSGTNSSSLPSSRVYKPKWMPYVLSIRSTPKGPYTDSSVTYNDDGSWSWRYAREENKGRAGESLFTNRALQANIDDRIPVGAIYKEKEHSP
jgi:hypothetical protein